MSPGLPGTWIAGVYTLGCKLNQLESEAIAGAFRGEGIPVMPWDEVRGFGNGPADRALLIINTCTVTSKSEQKARRLIRKALRDNRKTLIIVTGCYAQMEAEALESLDGDETGVKRVFVIPGEEKSRILELPGFLAANEQGFELPALVASWAAGRLSQNPGEFPPEDLSFRFTPGDFSFHSRAFLKIQDGCDNRCTYCRVRIARGKSRSLGAAEALTALRSLEERGYGEAVLTGVNISQYAGLGADGKPRDLPGILDYFLSGTTKIRLRLSSIEPAVYSPSFIRAVSRERIRPHFHFSLQSGSPAVLARMKRSYTPEEALEGVRLLRAARDDPFLGCDIITGFPGETPEDFEKTYEFCRKAGFAGIHVFPFSRRPGTEAWDFKDRVPEKEAGSRAGKLTALARANRKAYLDRWMGKEVEAIAEEDEEAGGDCVPAVSENYLKLLVSVKNAPPPKAGSLLRCRILDEGERPNEKMSRYDAQAELTGL